MSVNRAALLKSHLYRLAKLKNECSKFGLTELSTEQCKSVVDGAPFYRIELNGTSPVTVSLVVSAEMVSGVTLSTSQETPACRRNYFRIDDYFEYLYRMSSKETLLRKIPEFRQDEESYEEFLDRFYSFFEELLFNELKDVILGKKWICVPLYSWDNYFSGG